MSTDAQIIADIDTAFGDIDKPEHFTDYNHCEECWEHDQLLRDRDRATLTIEDIGDPCWTPMPFCSPKGFAYYLPSLVRLALSPPVYGYDWYGARLGFHLSYNDLDNKILKFCNAPQRRAVTAMLAHLMKVGADRSDQIGLDDVGHAYALWSGAQ